MESFNLIFKCTLYLLRIQRINRGVFQLMKGKSSNSIMKDFWQRI